MNAGDWLAVALIAAVAVLIFANRRPPPDTWDRDGEDER